MSKTQYVLIERPDCNPTAVSRRVLAHMLERGEETILSQRDVTKTEIKADRIHVWEDDHYFESVSYSAFLHKVKNKTFSAKVLWFRLQDGTGMLAIDGLGNWPIYACNIPGKKTWFPETACAFYEEGETVEVKIEPFFKNSLVVGLTPGYVDQVKWDSLDQENLAFRCNERGEATNGLFK